MRAVIERMVATSAPAEVFAGVADDLRAVAARLEGYPQEPIYLGYAEAATAGDAAGPFDNSPLLGRANPLAPPLRLRLEDGRIVGTARFGSAYEGPPGCVHGGFVAAAFDEVLGAAQSLSGQPGMTGRLTVHYRSPTPLHGELRFTGVFDRVEGRKIFTSGTVHAGERLCAEAEALFVSIDFKRFAELKAAREEQRAARADRD